MKSIDLWNQLISDGNKVIDNRIYPSDKLEIKAKRYNGSYGKCLVEYLEKIDEKVYIKKGEKLTVKFN